jgi:leucine dehydrogenase
MLETVSTSTHEAIFRARREDLGVEFFIALHSTRLGPAFGGARMWRYATEDEALRDVLRLSEGMTYKNAVAELEVGGGKSVIWLKEPNKASRRAIFEAFGEALEAVGDRYITAEDVGTSVSDMLIVRERTANVAGLPPKDGLAGGDPSPWTALGVFCAMEAILKRQGAAIRGSTVAIQGCGAVGAGLAELLAQAGAQLVVSDIDEARARAVAERFDAQLARPETILEEPAEIFAPCALGGVLNEDSIAHLRAPFVIGAANNQLATAEDAERLAARGIVYAPDYVVNAGGIIAVMQEHRRRLPDFVETKVRTVGERTESIVAQAEAEQRTPAAVARARAEAILARAAPAKPAVAAIA